MNNGDVDSVHIADQFAKIRQLQIPPGSYVLFGSAPICVRGIRSCRDLDIVVTGEIWEQFAQKSDWRHGTTKHGSLSLLCENIEMFSEWKPGIWDVPALIAQAEIIDGLPFARMAEVLAWKRMSGREKDKVDIALIESYLEKNR